MSAMIDTREVIIKLKQVKAEKNLSFDKILSLMEKNDQYLSKSTLSRVFADGSEEKSFRYEGTLRPIANALLDIENIEVDDDIDIQAYKSILKLKKELLDESSNQIKELKKELTSLKESMELKESKERIKYHDKLEKETARFQKSIDFLKNQVTLKDKRIDQLIETNARIMEHVMLLQDKLN